MWSNTLNESPLVLQVFANQVLGQASSLWTNTCVTSAVWWRAISNLIINITNLHHILIILHMNTLITISIAACCFFDVYMSISLTSNTNVANRIAVPILFACWFLEIKNKNQFFTTSPYGKWKHNSQHRIQFEHNLSLFVGIIINSTHRVSFGRITFEHNNNKIRFITDCYLLRRYRFQWESIPRDSKRNNSSVLT